MWPRVLIPSHLRQSLEHRTEMTHFGVRGLQAHTSLLQAVLKLALFGKRQTSRRVFLYTYKDTFLDLEACPLILKQTVVF